MSKKYEAIMLEEEAREEFMNLKKTMVDKDNVTYTNTELLNLFMHFYQANIERLSESKK